MLSYVTVTGVRNDLTSSAWQSCSSQTLPRLHNSTRQAHTHKIHTYTTDVRTADSLARRLRSTEFLDPRTDGGSSMDETLRTQVDADPVTRLIFFSAKRKHD